MNTLEFLLQLRSQGIDVRMRDDRLLCNAPKGALPPALREEIAARKQELLAFLRRAEKHRGSSPPPMARRPKNSTAQLSFSQERMWFLEQLDPQATYNNLLVPYRLNGPLHKEALTRTLNDIVKRNETLRTTFSLNSGTPLQVIHPHSEFKLTEIDLSHLPENAQQAELIRFFDKEFRKPIDITQLPLFRTFLIKERETQHILSFVCHHIIFDGWSYDIFLNELDNIYETYLSDIRPALPDLKIQYGDYCAWLREWMQGDVLEERLAYWREYLSGELSVLEMPTDRPRPPTMTYAGAREAFSLSQSIVDKLEELGRSQGASLHMVLMAIFKTLIYRYTFQNNIIIGFPILSRTRPEVENLIGCFVNTLVLKTQMHSDHTFLDVLANVRNGCLNAYRYQDTPFEKIVEAINPSRDFSRTPLYQAIFMYHDVRERTWKMADISITLVRYDPPTVQTDIYFWAQNMGNGLLGGLDYRTDLFHADTMKRFINNYKTLINEVIAQPDKSIVSFSILSEAEKYLVLQEWNKTGCPYAPEASVHELFELQAAKTPDAIAAVFEQETITYHDLNDRANQLARYLKRQGVGLERLVGIFVERSISMIVGLLGIFKAGGAYIPLDPLFPKDRLSFMLDDSGASVLITQKSLQDELLIPSGTKVVCLDTDWHEISLESSENISEQTDTNNLAYVLYTSGSTGVPKGVEITHRALVNFLCSMQKEPGIAADDVLLAVTTLSFDIAGLELFLPLISGAKVVIVPWKVVADGQQLTALLEKSSATIMQATPITWRMLLEAGWQGSKSLKILCGGEAFPADLAGPLLNRSAEVWNMYGPTETTIWSTLHSICSKDDPILIGRPIANTQIYILDDHMMPVPIGVAGELYIGGDGLARGYLNRPELTAERFITHVFEGNAPQRLYKTGDMARYCHDGNIECLGRSDFQVKIRGYRIELGEIEAVLQKHPAVRSAVVTARDAGDGDMRLVAYLICQPEAEQPSALALKEQARGTLPAYMLPSAYVFLDRFPLTPNGKIDRKALPAPDAGAQSDKSVLYTPPRNDIERTIASIWQSLLHIKQVDIYDSFFDLGGHSLLALRLFSR
ncbi:MAG: amino acid adenylation domain-containing protein, partial [Pseudomonadota bacterium]